MRHFWTSEQGLQLRSHIYKQFFTFQNTNYSTQKFHDHFPFRPKQIVHNRCSRGFVVPLFSSKKRELFTGDNLGRSSDAFSPFSRQRSSSFECRTTVPPWRPTFWQLFVCLDGWFLEDFDIYNQGLFRDTILSITYVCDIQCIRIIWDNLIGACRGKIVADPENCRGSEKLNFYCFLVFRNNK